MNCPAWGPRTSGDRTRLSAAPMIHNGISLVINMPLTTIRFPSLGNRIAMSCIYYVCLPPLSDNSSCVVSTGTAGGQAP